jgi:hypothetical protein
MGCVISRNGTIECAEVGNGVAGSRCDFDEDCGPGLHCNELFEECLPFCRDASDCGAGDVCVLINDFPVGRCTGRDDCSVFEQTGCGAGEGCYAVYEDQTQERMTFCATAASRMYGCQGTGVEEPSVRACAPGFLCSAGGACMPVCDPGGAENTCGEGGQCVDVLGGLGACMTDEQMECHPLEATTCAARLTCHMTGVGDFRCLDLVGTAEIGEGCEFGDVCVPGAVCTTLGCLAWCLDGDDCSSRDETCETEIEGDPLLAELGLGVCLDGGS